VNLSVALDQAGDPERIVILGEGNYTRFNIGPIAKPNSKYIIGSLVDSENRTLLGNHRSRFYWGR
jgi:hypothetical protein